MIHRFIHWLRGDQAPPPFDYRHIPDSADEWRSGDVAVAVTDSWHIVETGAPPPFPCPALGDMLHVTEVNIALGPQMLRFREYADTRFTAYCFRKRRPDAAEACDKSFLSMLKKRNQVVAASGIETEGHDGETRHGAEHESPTAESGDAQPSGPILPNKERPR